MKKIITAVIICMVAFCFLASCAKKTENIPLDQPESNQPALSEANSDAWSSGDSANSYIDILSSGKYYVKYRTVGELDGNTIESIMETATDGENVVAITNTENTTISTIIKGDTMYMVLNDNKQVFVSTGLEMNENAFPVGGFVFKSSGVADFFDVEHKYEEYTTDGGDVRFFFDDAQKLIGFENSSENWVEQREILEISNIVPEGIFDIPADYEVIEF